MQCNLINIIFKYILIKLIEVPLVLSARGALCVSSDDVHCDD